MSNVTGRLHVIICLVAMLVAGAQLVQAQAPPATKPGAAGAVDAKPFKPEELEQLAAPIALYPDSLVAQILMASTYPLEVVQADRWRAANKDLKGDPLASALNKQQWDASVKSLVDFPQVLEMMSKQLDWTTKLGDAFIADQAAVLAAVQRLRAKAKAAGNLKDSPEQKVVVQQAPPTTVVVQGAPPPTQIIKIEPVSPTVVYVPAYNPTVVYGAWPYPAYPPPPPPPSYVPGSNLVSFGAGVAMGAAWGHAWGNCNWGGGDVDVDVNRNANFNQNINRQAANANIQNRSGTAARGASANSFAHDPSHRKGVSYRDQASAAKVGQASANSGAAAARQDFRGRTEAGSKASPSQQTANQRAGSAERGASASQRPANQSGGGANRAASPSAASSGRGGAFEGASAGGTSARASSDRGQASRSNSSASRGGSGSGGGASRGGGGGSRGGGGGGGGRGGGGRR